MAIVSTCDKSLGNENRFHDNLYSIDHFVYTTLSNIHRVLCPNYVWNNAEVIEKNTNIFTGCHSIKFNQRIWIVLFYFRTVISLLIY